MLPDKAQVEAALAAGNGTPLVRFIIDMLAAFDGPCPPAIVAEQQGNVDQLADFCLDILSDARLEIPPAHLHRLITLNTVLGNLTRLSHHKTADAFIRTLDLATPQGAHKFFVLYSHYCTAAFDEAVLFQTHPFEASVWLGTLLKSSWFAEKTTHALMRRLLASEAVRKHFVTQEDGKPLLEQPAWAFFHSTYADPDLDKGLRNRIHEDTRQRFKITHPQHTPDFSKILVISDNMRKGHPVYRAIAPMLRALKPHYQLDLFHLRPQLSETAMDRDLFTCITPMAVENGAFTEAGLKTLLAQENYGIIFYTDIGLNRPSVILSNLRLAPIQVGCYGHPISSGMCEIDYFIAGDAVEDIDAAKTHYDETLVLIPGLAVEPVWPEYELTRPQTGGETFEIGCSWGALKVNYDHLQALKEILERTRKPVRFNMIGLETENLLCASARHDLHAMFAPAQMQVIPKLDQQNYMKIVEACHLMIDSFHFGSYNRVVDALHCRKLMVTLRGDRAYNRLASALLEQVGLPELVADSTAQYVDITARLIEDDAFRASLEERLAGIDLQATLFGTGNERYFKDAMDAIVAHHQCGGAKTILQVPAEGADAAKAHAAAR